MEKILLIGVGGFAGSILRYVLSGVVQQWSGTASFPVGTLAVNLFGCFLIGLGSQLVEARAAFSPELRILLFAGLLGGFTTFSTFGNESLNLLRNGGTGWAMFNIGAHIGLGLFAVWAGRLVAHLVWR